MSGLFITGTDTGCGKTSVGRALAIAARAQGLRVRVLKPVETGCELVDGEPHAADAVALARAAADRSPIDEICPHRLRLAAAPKVAAAREGVAIDVPLIDKLYREAAACSDLVLVEGAGGLRVPITAGLDMAGLAQRLRLPLLVVARAALGTINHTLLTLDVAAARGLRAIGVVVSHTRPGLPPGDHANLGLLRATLPVRLIGELPFGATELSPPVDVRELLDSVALA